MSKLTTKNLTLFKFKERETTKFIFFEHTKSGACRSNFSLVFGLNSHITLCVAGFFIFFLFFLSEAVVCVKSCLFQIINTFLCLLVCSRCTKSLASQPLHYFNCYLIYRTLGLFQIHSFLFCIIFVQGFFFTVFAGYHVNIKNEKLIYFVN